MVKKECLPAAELETGKNPVASIIWLHGLGADGHDFISIVPQLGLPKDLPVRFIFPHAPTMPVTVNGGFVMPAWYDLYEMRIGNAESARQDEQGIKKSAASIVELITRENERGIPTNRIILVGFSQGGAMALHIGIRQAEALAGIVALSCYLPLHKKVADEVHPSSLQTPIFIAHGTDDDVVQRDYGQRSAALLEQLEYDMAWHEYPMGHTVSHTEITDIGNWITSKLS